jgi:hypothetical protein
VETLICSLCQTRIDKLYVVFKPDHRIFYYHMYCYEKHKPIHQFFKDKEYDSINKVLEAI